MARSMAPIARGSLLALAAAALFGATTPLVQRFGREVSPFVTAAALYCGAAMASIPLGGRGREAPLRRTDLPRLVVVAVTGAAAAPLALAWGLQRTDGTTASLLLNMEAVFTVALARVIYREAIGRRVLIAVALMVVGGAVLALRGTARAAADVLGIAAVTAATFGWALDNTLTRPLADRDPRAVVLAKAALGSTLSIAAALALSARTPPARTLLGLVLCGVFGYGLSLRLYLVAQRVLGAARTGSIFALAPFVGAVIAFAMGARDNVALHAAAAALFVIAVILHVTETHGHHHRHTVMVHEHAHRHDDGHHNHWHEPEALGAHSHVHEHSPIEHDHAHGPDLHHGHDH